MPFDSAILNTIGPSKMTIALSRATALFMIDWRPKVEPSKSICGGINLRHRAVAGDQKPLFATLGTADI
jgi:hypothetical protein